MSPKVVSKTTYYCWTLLFYSLCLSGLIWQITQISINFFKFEVLKDINVITPDKMNTIKYSKDEVVYFCFDNSDIVMPKVYKYFATKFRRKINKTIKFDRSETISLLPLNERFMMTREWQKIETTHDTPINEFIEASEYCFKTKTQISYEINQQILPNYESFLRMSISNNYSPFDERRLIEIPFPDDDYGDVIEIKSNKYFINELEWPYTDNCLNYQDIGFKDRNDAIASCDEHFLNKTPKFGFIYQYISSFRIAWKSEYKLNNYSIADLSNNTDECKIRYYKEQCEQKLYLTQIASTSSIKQFGSSMDINILSDVDASYNVNSKPRVDNIDYVTYILGAMGSWIGFSFIGINPIPYFIKTKTKKVESANFSILKITLDDHVKKSKDDSVRLQLHISSLEQTIKELKANFAQMSN